MFMHHFILARFFLIQPILSRDFMVSSRSAKCLQENGAIGFPVRAAVGELRPLQ